MTSPTFEGPGQTGLPAPITDPGAHSSEATAGPGAVQVTRSIAANKEQVASSHRGTRVLMRDMTHETRDGGEASARTLAAPVVAIAKGRENGRQEGGGPRVGQHRSSHA